jgi:hypothetical protein
VLSTIQPYRKHRPRYRDGSATCSDAIAHSNPESRGCVVNTNCEVECADGVIHLNPAKPIPLLLSQVNPRD